LFQRLAAPSSVDQALLAWRKEALVLGLRFFRRLNLFRALGPIFCAVREIRSIERLAEPVDTGVALTGFPEASRKSL
jgi:hypothetical protein